MPISLDRMTVAVALLALCVALAPLGFAAGPGSQGTCHHHIGLVIRAAILASAQMSAGLTATLPHAVAVTPVLAASSGLLLSTLPDTVGSPLPLRI